MSDAYVAFADRLLEGGLLHDAWIDGRPRFRDEPVVVREAELAALHRAAEAVAFAYDETCRIVAREPSLLDDFFGMTPYQKLMWLASQPRWHGIARADVFRRRDGGIAVCELNSDTPTGEPEAVALGILASAPGFRDPNAALEARFGEMIDAVCRRPSAGAGRPREGDARVGIVYPTEMTEDLSLVRLYRRWLEARGYDAVLGSPFNLTTHDDGRPTLLGAPCAVLLRHYKTDWFGERSPVWTDEDAYADSSPLLGALSVAIGAEASGHCAVVNPFGAVLTQNKRSMAFMWEHLDRYSDEARRAIVDFIPETARLEAVGVDALRAEQGRWVLKSDYGCEGEEVVVGRLASAADWEESLAKAIPERWVAQRYFEAEVDARGDSINYGVFVLAGEACGLYARVEPGMTTHDALSAPALVAP